MSHDLAADGALTETTDAELLRRVADGDTEAFAELYRRHADAAWRAARTIVADHDDAADAVAEAFTKILRAARSGRAAGIEHFRAYLLTATRNAALDRRRRIEESRDMSSDTDESWPSADPSPAEVVIDLTDEAFVARAYHALPERWQRVLWLTEVRGLRPVDVADELGMNPNSVAQLTFRARAGLRDRFVSAHFGDVAGDCAEVVEHLAAFVGGRLADSIRARVETHLEACEPCRHRCDEASHLVSAVRR